MQDTLPSHADEVPDFAPVPTQRTRRDGWTPERQRLFITVLAETGLVAAAAKAAGMGVTSAYNLRKRPGAESFVTAWDMVQDAARERALAFIVDQFENGVTRPRLYRGKFVGTQHKYETRIALAVLRATYAQPPRSAK